MHRWGGKEAFPSVITVFSAPNYCHTYKNKGAVILIENDKMNIKQYKDVAEPFNLPNNLDLFSWSLPFLVDKIGEMLDYLMKKQQTVPKDALKLAKRSSDVDFDKIMTTLEKQEEEQEKARMNKIKAKVMSVARFSLILKKDKQNHDLIEQAKKMNPDGKLKPGEILSNFKGTKYDLDNFVQGHQEDKVNEKFPIAAFRRTSLKHGQLTEDQLQSLQQNKE